MLDAHLAMTTGEITTALQVMADNGLERVINHAGGNRADHSLDLWVAMRGEVKGRIVQCWNPPWQLMAGPGGDATPLVQDLVDAVGMFYACASVGVRGAPPMPVSDARLDPLWAKAAELRLPVYLHAAADNAEALPARHPRTRFIFTHPPPTDLEALLGDHERVYFTLSAFPAASPPLPLIRRFPDRFVFASGVSLAKEITLPGHEKPVPFGAVRPAYDEIRQSLATLPQDLQDGLFRGNLLKIF